MIRRLALAALAAIAFSAHAAVDANQANQAELEAVKGIGPTLATRILDERKKSSFRNWADLMERVKGIGEANATRLSTAGLTVGGAAFQRPAAK